MAVIRAAITSLWVLVLRQETRTEQDCARHELWLEGGTGSKMGRGIPGPAFGDSVDIRVRRVLDSHGEQGNGDIRLGHVVNANAEDGSRRRFETQTGYGNTGNGIEGTSTGQAGKELGCIATNGDNHA